MHLFKALELSNFLALVSLLLLYLEVEANHNASIMPLQQAIDEQLNREQNYDHLLTRKRRYLEFPSGSSFQLVYDLIVGVVDFTNYLILGVTVALAWELPSKPPSEVLTDLRDRLKDGTLGTTRNDTITNIKYVDTKTYNQTRNQFSKLQPLFRPPMHFKYYTSNEPDRYYRYQNHLSNALKWKGPKYNSWSKSNNYYNSKPSHPFSNWIPNRRKFPVTSNAAKYPWWNLKSRLPTYYKKQKPIQGSRRFDQNIRNPKRQRIYKATGRSDHRIFPIFGKRNINDKIFNRQKRKSFSKLDQIHIRHHRSTRYDLYERIETYLNGRGSNGHHCVLRALCETGQKSGEHKPGSFVGEIMRAIFTLPEAPQGGTEKQSYSLKKQRYDNAHALTESCALRYHLCKDSLWSSHFVM